MASAEDPSHQAEPVSNWTRGRIFLVDADSDQKKLVEDLDTLRIFSSLCQDHILCSAEDYIWHEGAPEFRMVEGNKDGPGVPPHVGFSMQFGDNISDEWFLVFMLFDLSKRFDDAVMTIWDNDGEFLLVEAAEFLPAWLEPSTATNRVYIHRGQLHIIPMVKSPGQMCSVPVSLSLHSGPIAVHGGSPDTIASKSVRSAVLKRMKGFPERVFQENRHCVRCIVPKNVALVLSSDHRLIAAAVESFYMRDVDGLKSCADMKTFNPSDSVECMIRFTRVQYAQLMGQKFQPPPVFRLPQVGSKDYKAADLGTKVACGFEMLYNEFRRGISGSEGPSISDQRAWESYKKKLLDIGYFRGEIAGSKGYRARENRALEHFLKARDDAVKSGQGMSAEEIRKLSVVQGIATSLKSGDCPFNIGGDIRPDDDDSWMHVTESDMQKMFSNHGRGTDNGDGFDLEKVASSMNDFMQKVSGLEGAEVSGRDADDVGLDPHAFMKIMSDVLGIEAEDGMGSNEGGDEDAASEDSEDEFWDGSGSNVVNDLSNLMHSMDAEVNTNLKSGSVPNSNPDEGIAPGATSSDDLDLNINLVKNLLESVSAQDGMPGPAANLLGEMGIRLPGNADNLQH